MKDQTQVAWRFIHSSSQSKKPRGIISSLEGDGGEVKKIIFLPPFVSPSGWTNNQTSRRQINRRKKSELHYECIRKSKINYRCAAIQYGT